ncbi:hypothetical protein LCGC14_0668020 [marine sediment metagenome]|uniref:Uncharacterized protein n=1 Tax=marine sediment metagenome TaxID=412755 RepID=A0A0F9TD81_9ZZZZ
MDILEQAKKKLKEQNQQSTPKIKFPKKKKPIKKAKITQDKDMDKDEIVFWLNNYITENQSLLTLDFLRSQKLILESIVEMRK